MLVPTARQADDIHPRYPGRGADGHAGAAHRAWRWSTASEVTCPVAYIGYHLRTVSEAAHEALDRGAALADITPFWRVLSGKAPTTKRLTFGADFVADQRKREGLQD